jgi:hypothetical protein
MPVGPPETGFRSVPFGGITRAWEDAGNPKYDLFLLAEREGNSGKFNQKASVSRVEMAVVLYRVLTGRGFSAVFRQSGTIIRNP